MSWSKAAFGRANFTVVGLTAAFVVLAHLLAARYGFPLKSHSNFTLIIFTLVYTQVVLGLFAWRCFRERPESPISFVRVFLSRYRLIERAALALPVLLALDFFFPTFGSMKSAIATMQPFHDPVFADWDEALHGGQAWRLLHPLLGYHAVTWVVSMVYHSWLILFYAVLMWIVVSVDRPALRDQFLIAFVLCWALLGSLVATLGASVGPCFYDDFFASDRYRPLMDYLTSANRDYPLGVLEIQGALLESYRLGIPGLGRGISAVPSMHVSIAMLMALAAWRVSRAWGVVGTLYLVMIVVGSVHLGYHYAIDSYAALIGTPLIWVLSGWRPRSLLHRLRPAVAAAAPSRA